MTAKRSAVTALLLLLLITYHVGSSQHVNQPATANVAEKGNMSAEEIDAQEKDAQLLKAVRAAIRKNPSAAQIEKIVGIESAINTTKQYHRFQLERMMDVARDPDDEANNKPLPDFRKAKDVVFWVRPVGDKFPRIVGVYWNEHNEIVLFFAILLDR